MTHWHQTDPNELLQALQSQAEGLSETEAQRRLQEHGRNALQEKEATPAWMFFLHQFKDFMILILLAAAIISGIMGDWTDTIIILIIVLLNAIVGFVQEYRAERAMAALKKMASASANVLRDGRWQSVPAAMLVPGDRVQIEAGNVVPADLRLFEAHSLRIDESALTGESLVSEKHSDTLEQGDIPLGDRGNMAYKSTLVANGRGVGTVVATGMKTEIGKIAQLLQQDELETPLKKRMADFGKKLSYLILFICLLLFVVGMLRGEKPMEMLLLSISLAVAAIPEALPALITIALAKGAQQLMGKKALIRKLPAVETLGSVTFICSDKTGTLTLNKMTVVERQASEHAPFSHLKISPFLAGLVLNNDVKISADGGLIGDPTETALVDAALLEISPELFEDILESFPRVAELPFDSDRKCMTTVHRYQDHFLVFSKGATEAILPRLHDDEDREGVELLSGEWGGKGLRVLVFAFKRLEQLPDPFTYQDLESDLHFIGMVGMIDPPREEVKQAIADCKTAGIKPVMITGDHPATAQSIARSIGILNEQDLAITGAELSAMTDQDFADKVQQISVYARVSPEQKLRIVRALQQQKHFVSMTGDGVNDAPSLKMANIGVAMGINGTDVSKEAAHMILLDDNFATIVKAVHEGRRIYDNIRKFIKYIMTCNSAEIWTIFLAPILALPNPLLPIHILWINLVTDGLPGLALASERAERDIMRRPPRPSNESLFADGIGWYILWVGILMAGMTLGMQYWAISTGVGHWQTMVFSALAFAQLGQALAVRSERNFVYQQGLFSNMPLIGAVLLTVVLQLGIIYLPFANHVFETQPLSALELLICFIPAVLLFHIVEFYKAFRYRRHSNHSTRSA